MGVIQQFMVMVGCVRFGIWVVSPRWLPRGRGSKYKVWVGVRCWVG